MFRNIVWGLVIVIFLLILLSLFIFFIYVDDYVFVEQEQQEEIVLAIAEIDEEIEEINMDDIDLDFNFLSPSSPRVFPSLPSITNHSFLTTEDQEDEYDPYPTEIDIIREINNYRASWGRSVLQADNSLNLVAQSRLRHILEDNQNGDFPLADYAINNNYNFALMASLVFQGQFFHAEDLVQAWAKRPSHNDYLLINNHRHIGLAIGREKDEYIIVIVFARPLSDCSLVDGNLKVKIENNIKEMEELKLIYENNSEKDEDLLRRINNIHRVTKASWAEYNSQIRSFNACLGW